MSHISLESKVQQLEVRVDRLEEKSVLKKVSASGGPKFTTKALDSIFINTMRWTLLTIVGLATFSDWLQNHQYNTLLLFLLVLAIWWIVRDYHIGFSDSTLYLMQQERTRRPVESKSLHHATKVLLKRTETSPVQLVRTFILMIVGVTFALLYGWLAWTYIADSAWQSFVFMIPAIVVLSYSVYVRNRFLYAVSGIVLLMMCALSLAPLFAILAALLIGLSLAYFSWLDKAWHIFLVAVLASYAVLGRWIAYFLLSANKYNIEANSYLNHVGMGLALSLCLFFIAFSLPFAFLSRSASQRQTIRHILMGNALAFSALSLWFLLNGESANWSVVYLVSIMGSLLAGYVAWLHNARLSYAKYYFIVAGAATLLLFSIQADYTAATIVWLIMSGLCLASGFLINSYTLRVAGLILLVGTLIQYVGLALPSNIDAIWVGNLLAALLLIVVYWYQVMPLVRVEKLQRIAITQGAFLGVFAIIFSFINLLPSHMVQTVLWEALAGVMWWIGSKLKLTVLHAVGVSLAGVVALKFLISDNYGWATEYRALSYLILVSLLLVVWYLLGKYGKKMQW